MAEEDERSEQAHDAPAENGPVSGEQLERDWERALETASGAVSAAGSARTLNQTELDAERHQLNEERRWLGGIGSTMRKLFGSRGSGQEQ
jgi:hypothetical protein